MKKNFKIATRQSPMALWQAKHVQQQLQQRYPHHDFSLLPLTTTGDKFLQTSLAKLGGKGLFLKELEEALLSGEADLAVHSAKDVPADLDAAFTLAAYLPRDDARDALIVRDDLPYPNLASLPQGARIGTSSFRRTSLLLHTRPDLKIELLRGNVQTRLRKLNEGQFEATIVSAAGFIRLQLQHYIREYLASNIFIPAIGQGVICIECRTDDLPLITLLQSLDDKPTRACLSAERALSKKLQGGCHAPVGGYAVSQENRLHLRAFVAAHDGSTMLRVEKQGSIMTPENVGLAAAEELLQLGASQYLSL